MGGKRTKIGLVPLPSVAMSLAIVLLLGVLVSLQMWSQPAAFRDFNPQISGSIMPFPLPLPNIEEKSGPKNLNPLDPSRQNDKGGDLPPQSPKDRPSRLPTSRNHKLIA